MCENVASIHRIDVVSATLLSHSHGFGELKKIRKKEKGKEKGTVPTTQGTVQRFSEALSKVECTLSDNINA
jgi:hypothetical protein